MPKEPRYKKFLNMSYQELGRMNKDELVEAVRTLRRTIAQRKRTFDETPEVFSPALDAYQRRVKGPRKNLSKRSRNSLLAEFAMQRDFLKSKTSTVSGAREVYKTQSQRIFQEDSRWGARRTMTREEARRYWEVYNEFKNVYPDMMARIPSEQIQQILGSMAIDTNFFGEDGEVDLMEALENLHERIEEFEQEHYDDWSDSGWDELFSESGDGIPN